MSNMKVTFWHNYASAETTDVPMRETSLAVGTLSTTIYLAHTDAQSLLDAMIVKGMKPSNITLEDRVNARMQEFPASVKSRNKDLLR